MNFFNFFYTKLSTINNNIFLTGEFEYEGIFNADQKLEFPSMTYLLFILFLVFMSIIIVNLMIGLAVDDIKVSIGFVRLMHKVLKKNSISKKQ